MEEKAERCIHDRDFVGELKLSGFEYHRHAVTGWIMEGKA